MVRVFAAGYERAGKKRERNASKARRERGRKGGKEGTYVVLALSTDRGRSRPERRPWTLRLAPSEL